MTKDGSTDENYSTYYVTYIDRMKEKTHMIMSIDAA